MNKFLNLIVLATTLAMGCMVIGCVAEFDNPIKKGFTFEPSDVENDRGEEGGDVAGQTVDGQTGVDTPSPPACTRAECNDNNVCTDDYCDPEIGCIYEPNNSGSCEDGNACTEHGYCFDGICQDGQTINCDDKNACTEDSCDPEIGCVYQVDPCNDGIDSTKDWCDPTDGCHHEKIDCDDDKPCNDDNPCTEDWCDEEGSCVFEPTHDGDTCSDGNACTAGESCYQGSCLGGVLINCSDGNPCTDDSCNPEMGCAYGDNTLPCTDDNPCTISDICADGICQPGDELNCDDENACTEDFCDQQTGECSYEYEPDCIPCAEEADCEDGNMCTFEWCDEGICQSVPLHLRENTDETICDDGDVCTMGYCSFEQGECVYTPVNCNDGDPNTADSCDSQIGCVHECIPQCESKECGGDGCGDWCGQCSIDSTCVAGVCEIIPECTEDSDCNDDNACTTDSCMNNSCAHGVIVCDNDDNLCNGSETCEAQLGCQNSGDLNCNDNNACTDDSCDPATGCVFTPIICDDGNTCTDDVCDSQAGCIFDPIEDCCESDVDCDGILDPSDNCPDDFNPEQEDVDKDSIGDPCDPQKNCTVYHAEDYMPQGFYDPQECVHACIIPGTIAKCLHLYGTHVSCGVDSDYDGPSELEGDCADTIMEMDPVKNIFCWEGNPIPPPCTDDGWTVTIQ
jgi:hypothetical protein